jgi:Transglutaminase-like superfamily/Bacterial transglutaminase-like N-terminal region
MKFSIRHSLSFSLGTPARAVQHLLLTALSTPQQKVERWSIDMPGIAGAAMFRDAFGNQAHLVTQVKPEGAIEVTVTGVVETFDKSGVLGRLDYDPVPAIFRHGTARTRAVPMLIEGLSPKAGRIPMLHELMDRVHAAESTQTQAQSAAEQSQSQGTPSVADMVEAFVGAARGLDVAARYVTGYLWDEGEARLHAWAEAWDDGLGWIGFDPLLNVCPAAEHVRLASGLDAMGTMPIRSVPVWAEMPVESVTMELDQDPST